MEFQFKKSLTEEKRKRQCNILLIKNPNKVPVILEKDPKCKIEGIKKTKFLVQKDFTINQFSKMIRSFMTIPEEDALFFTIKGKYTITGQKSIGQIYKDFKDIGDGFLYIAYTTEIVYG